MRGIDPAAAAKKEVIQPWTAGGRDGYQPAARGTSTPGRSRITLATTRVSMAPTPGSRQPVGQAIGDPLCVDKDVCEALLIVVCLLSPAEGLEVGKIHHKHGHARGDHESDCDGLSLHGQEIAEELVVEGLHQESSWGERLSALRRTE